jgi:hypothetical protein
MSGARKSISRARSYKELGEFWDNHDLADYWDRVAPVDFDVELRSEVTYFPLDRTLAADVVALAGERGISAETLLNLWVQEKLREQSA